MSNHFSETAMLLDFFEEPLLEFGYSQTSDNPRDGLFMFGPVVDSGSPKEMRIGIVGTKEGIRLFRNWSDRILRYIPPAVSDSPHHTPFPGFSELFDCTWPSEPVATLEVSAVKIAETIRGDNRRVSIHDTVSLFEEKIVEYLDNEGDDVSVWFVVIPEDVHRYGRPKSFVPRDEVVPSKTRMNSRMATRLLTNQPSLFEEDNAQAEKFRFDPNFHHQLKARLLKYRAVIQIVRETTIMGQAELATSDQSRRLQDDASVAWNLCTTAYFKASGKPWRLADVREGVCYVGVVFKQETNPASEFNACCGAQLFLDSGDGLIFKGAHGNWYKTRTNQFHLEEKDAKELMESVIKYYVARRGHPPKEVFIHGRTRFNKDEWRGFCEAVPSDTKMVAIRITPSQDIKLYRPGKMPVIRGSGLRMSERKGYLWTKGFIPRLQTYPGREVPNPLGVEVTWGEANLDQVMKDIMGLTKVNFNACIYADGLPVTLRFADAVGEILTAAPVPKGAPLPFKHYI